MGSDLHLETGSRNYGYYQGYQQAVRDLGKAVGELDPDRLTLAQIQRALATVRRNGPVNPLTGYRS